ncbi:MAG TPA: hypothetical protein VMX33_15125 [bacterium]|nr:hypothetical protein [bacterium]
MNRRPQINLSDILELHAQSATILAALKASTRDIFILGGILARVDRNEGRAKARALSVDAMRHEASESADFVRVVKRGDSFEIQITFPPMAAIRDAMAAPSWPFPVLDGIIRHPTIAPTGAIIATSGYDAATRFYVDLAPGLEGLTVPMTPTCEEVASARALIGDVFADFPFADEASRAGAFALFLTVLCRPLIDARPPVFLIVASAPGTGKTLLAQAAITPATGEALSPITETKNDDEFRKEILSMLLTGPEAVIVDNVAGRIDSGPLSALTTSDRFQGRILGRSEMVDLKAGIPFVLTSNNPSVSNEISRRCVPIRLSADVERPWLREGFRHADLLGYITAHHAELVRAGLILARAWCADERPLYSGRLLGSFERWHAVIGGILESAGIHGLLANASEFYETADDEAAAWIAFTSEWFSARHESPATVTELYESALAAGVIEEGRTHRGTLTGLGRALARMTGRVFQGRQITRGPVSGGIQLWRLKAVNP